MIIKVYTMCALTKKRDFTVVIDSCDIEKMCKLGDNFFVSSLLGWSEQRVKMSYEESSITNDEYLQKYKEIAIEFLKYCIDKDKQISVNSENYDKIIWNVKVDASGEVILICDITNATRDFAIEFENFCESSCKEYDAY